MSAVPEDELEIPTAPGRLPLIGHVLPLLRGPLRFFESLPRHGDLVQVRIGGLRTVIVCNPELTHEVLVHDRVYDKGGVLYARLREVLGNDGVATCPHREHRRQRRLIQPVFHQERYPEYVRAMTREIAVQIGKWNDGQTLDALTAALSITSRVAVKTMFSAPLPPSVIDGIVDDLNTAMAFMYKRLLIPRTLQSLPILGKRTYDSARTRLRESTDRIIAEYQERGIDYGDLLATMLRAQNQDSATGIDQGRGGLSDQEIGDQVVTFLLGGIEANAKTIAWALHVIARDPGLQKRLHAEADTVLAAAAPEFGDVPELDLTGRTVHETLRLYSIGWFFTRTTTEPARLGGYRIPAGTTVVYSPYLLQRREDLYHDADRFDPDRWAGEGAVSARSKAFVPFGGGARKCIGDTFAVVQATVTLAMIMSAWQVEPTTGAPLRTKINIQLSPNGGPLRVRAR